MSAQRSSSAALRSGVGLNGLPGRRLYSAVAKDIELVAVQIPEVGRIEPLSAYSSRARFAVIGTNQGDLTKKLGTTLDVRRQPYA